MDPLEVIKLVDDFYNSAWNKLIIFTTIIIAVVGVIIPILLTWWQNRTLRISEETLKKELEITLKSNFIKTEKKVSKSINEELEKRMTEIKQEIDNKIAKAEAYTFHIQGNIYIKEKLYKLAIDSYISAGYRYIVGKDFLNIGRINGSIKNHLGKLSKEELEELESENSEPSNYMQNLKDNNENMVFSDLISDLKKIVNKIKST